jgi:D-glycero-D-manno-heptose 1,7-bisphosphate phosphatase
LKLALLDRDGTLIDFAARYSDGTLRAAQRPDEVRLLVGVVAGLRALRDAGWTFAIATNQPGWAKGECAAGDIAETNYALVDTLAESGITIAGVRVCYHSAEAGCWCRKPKPGLLWMTIQDLGGRPRDVVMIGDSDADEGAAKAAGVRFYRVGTARGFAEAACAILADEREKTHAVS